MEALNYKASPAFGFAKSSSVFAAMVIFGALSFLWSPFVLLMFALVFVWAYQFYYWSDTTYNLANENLTVSYRRSTQKIDLSDVVSFRIECPLWLSFFSAERGYFKNASGHEIELYLYDHQINKIITQLPALRS